MRHVVWFGRACVVVLIAAAVPLAAGCFDTLSDCSLANTCDCPSPDYCPGTGGTGGAGGSVDPGCIPSTLPASTPLPATCTGVFVSGASGSDTTGDGTRTAPYASLGKALEGGAAVVYACAAQTGDSGTVTLPAGTSLFGGLDCADWHYAGDKTVLTPGTTTALVLAPGAGARVEDFHIESATATVPSASSIAVLSNAATSASLTRVELVAGDGAVGEAGLSVPADSALDGLPGGPGTDAPVGACNTQGETGGPGGQKTCGGVVVDGGNGGGAFTDPGGIGQEGQQPTAGTSGDGGVGQQIAAPSHSCSSSAAQPGADGTPGPDGTSATGAGALSATGYAGVDGTGGTPGLPGQGGGGGGASACTGGNTGPSGGGGGSGACGGAAGGAGRAAGASIALLAFGGEITLSDATLTTGAGGNGGPGGDGQPGGLGGSPGLTPGFPAPSSACIGASGGNGGPGGSGGGGLGGPSLGVASSSTAVVTLTNVSYTIGAAGPGGPGGDGKVTLDGAPGERCATLNFDTASCTPP
ncbi:MAG: hypothetical protein HY908_22340 [Myxococcales bacterium]|nr:hypothetical protein [Myxococcales bacterium]